ncbi:MAG TPA: hypothetical protein VFZ48_05145 [Candidatus Saccharimonadales bacterium]
MNGTSRHSLLEKGLEMTIASEPLLGSVSDVIAAVRDEFVTALHELGFTCSVIPDNSIPECSGRPCVRLDGAHMATARTQLEDLLTARQLCGSMTERQAAAAKLVRILQQLQCPHPHVIVHLHGSSKSLSVQFFRCTN